MYQGSWLGVLGGSDFSFFDVFILQGGADIGFELLSISGADLNEPDACWKDVPPDGHVALCPCYLAAG